jgi:glycerol uptake facilitator-like aquaporin
MPKPHQAPIPHFKGQIALALKVDPKGRSKYFIGKLDTLHPRILANFATFMTLSTGILGIKTYIKKKKRNFHGVVVGALLVVVGMIMVVVTG